MTTEQQKIDRLAEFMGLDKAPPYFQPFHDWNHTHMVLDKVMENYRLFWHLMDSIDAANFGTLKQDVKVLAKATKQELMDAVYNLLTNS